MGWRGLGSIPRVAARSEAHSCPMVRTGADLHVWRVRLRCASAHITFDLGTVTWVTPEPPPMSSRSTSALPLQATGLRGRASGALGPPGSADVA